MSYTLPDDAIDAAAAAAWNLKATRKWHQIPEEWKPFYRDAMRAGLTAYFDHWAAHRDPAKLSSAVPPPAASTTSPAPSHAGAHAPRSTSPDL